MLPFFEAILVRKVNALHNFELRFDSAVTEQKGGPYSKKYGRKHIKNAQFLKLFTGNYLRIGIL